MDHHTQWEFCFYYLFLFNTIWLEHSKKSMGDLRKTIQQQKIQQEAPVISHTCPSSLLTLVSRPALFTGQQVLCCLFTLCSLPTTSSRRRKGSCCSSAFNSSKWSPNYFCSKDWIYFCITHKYLMTHLNPFKYTLNIHLNPFKKENQKSRVY